MRLFHTRSALARSGVRLSICAVAVTLVVAGCSSSGSSSGGSSSGSSSSGKASAIPDGPIKVGIVGALSGAGSAIGTLVKNEFNAYATYLNAQGGIAGHQVQILFENNQSDPTIAVQAAQKLISQGIVASFYNGASQEGKEQVVAILQKAKVLGVAPESLAQFDDAKAYPYYFSDNISTIQVTAGLAAFAKSKKFDQFGVLTDGSPQAEDYYAEFQKATDKASLKIVNKTSYPTGSTTMTTQLSTLKDAGAKTLALFCYAGCGQVFDSLRQINWKPNILVSSNIYYTAFASVKDYGDVTYANCPYSVEQGGTLPAPALAAINAIAPALGGSSTLNQVFVQTADAFLILKYAIEKANSLDPDALRKVLEGMKAQSFTDPAVTFTFSDKHRSGYQPATTNKLTPMCGFTSLSADKIPIRVAY